MNQPADFKFSCQVCGAPMRGKAEWIGKKFKCPQCSTVQVLTGPSPAPAAPPPTSVPPVIKPAPVAAPRVSPAPVAFPRPGYPAAAPPNPQYGPPNPLPGFPPAPAPYVVAQPSPISEPQLNPYAAPSAGYAASSYQPQPLGPAQRVQAMDLFSRAFSLFAKNIVAVPVVAVAIFVINTLLPYGFGRLGWEMGIYRSSELRLLYSISTALFIGLLGIYVQVGIVKFALRAAQQARLELGQVLPNANEFLNGLLALFMQGVACALVIFVCMIPVFLLGVSMQSRWTAANNYIGIFAPLGGLGVGMCIVVFLVLLWYLTLVIVIDRKKDGLSAMGESQTLMNGNKLQVFLALLLMFVVVALPAAAVVWLVQYAVIESRSFGFPQLMIVGAANAASGGCLNVLYAFLCVATYMTIRRMPGPGTPAPAAPGFGGPGFGAPNPTFGAPGPTFGSAGPANTFADPGPGPIGSPGSSQPRKPVGPPPGF